MRKPPHVSHKEGIIGVIDGGDAAIDNPKPLFGKAMLCKATKEVLEQGNMI